MKELTENDIAPLWDGYGGGFFSGWASDYRAAFVRFANAILSRFGGKIVVDGRACVSESEARERERTAFNIGWLERESFPHREPQRTRDRIRENRYPSLSPEPRTVTLSDGSEWWLARDENRRGRWMREELTCSRNVDSGPSCQTAEDFEKCATLLREEEK